MRQTAVPSSLLRVLLLPLVVSLVAASGCSNVLWKSADQASRLEVDVDVAGDVEVPAGFRAVTVVEGLNYPSGLTFDDAGRMYVLESNTVPVPLEEMGVLSIDLESGEHEPLELTGPDAPSGGIGVGLAFHDGWLYLSHEQADGTFGISRFRPRGEAAGTVEAVVRGMPTRGDHDVNYLAFDSAGTLFFGVGSATNSGVVSSGDPVNQKWIETHPDAHDVPCRDLVLAGVTFEDENLLTEEPDDRAVTGAFQPYGSSDATRIEGRVPCSTGLFRLPSGAGEPELVAWGLRNPVAVAVDSEDRVFIGVHGADIRGTRPVRDDPDAIVRVREGAWYGWPDYTTDFEPVTAPAHQPPGETLPPEHERLVPVIELGASGLEPPDRSLLVVATEPHAAVGGMVFVPDRGPFARWAGRLLVSEMGDFKPVTDRVTPDERAGFQVEVVDVEAGTRETFARNRPPEDAPGQEPLPASLLDYEDAFERPVDLEFGPDGLLYVLDFGALSFADGQRGFPNTGKVFRIEPDGGGGER